MLPKLLNAILISLLCLALPAVTGCAWEDGTNQQDDGSDGDGTGNGDAYDAGGGIDEGPVYPPGPYGTGWMDTVENFKVVQCICPGGPAQGRDFMLEEFLGSKAILITAHAGWCGPCKIQAPNMEEDLWVPYRERGLKILLVIIEDNNGSSVRQDVLDYCCYYKETYGMSFVLAGDPGTQVMRDYAAATPLNMVLDDEMVIRYKVAGVLDDTLEGNINALLNE